MADHDGPYSRVYHAIVDDEKFATIYDDDRRLATWLRLLIVAEQAYPASANVPIGTHRATVLHLATVGLIDLGTGSRYRIHGLNTERERRAEAGRIGGLASGRSRAKGSTVERPLNDRPTAPMNDIERAKTRRDENEQRRDETSNGRAYPDGERDAQDVYHELTMFRPWGQWSGDEIKVAMHDYGNATVEAALRAEYAVSGDRDTLWKRTKTRLAKDADRAREERKAKPKPPKVDPEAAYVERKRVEQAFLDTVAAVKDVP